MGKSLTLTYKNKEYTLEYNRKAVRMMEGQGFLRDELFDRPATMAPLLIHGAFHMHHRNVKTDLIDAIYDDISNKTDLLPKLMEMYSEPVMELLGDKEPGDGEEETEKNVQWSANW